MIRYIKLVGAPGSGKSLGVNALCVALGKGQAPLIGTRLEAVYANGRELPPVLFIDEPNIIGDVKRFLESRHYNGTVYYAETGPA